MATKGDAQAVRCMASLLDAYRLFGLLSRMEPSAFDSDLTGPYADALAQSAKMAIQEVASGCIPEFSKIDTSLYFRAEAEEKPGAALAMLVRMQDVVNDAKRRR